MEIVIEVSIEVGRADDMLVMVAEVFDEVGDLDVLAEGIAMLVMDVDVDVKGVEMAMGDGSKEELEDVATVLQEAADVDTASGFEVLEGVLEATGAGITTVMGGELTSMIEYFVAVVVAVVATGVWVIVTKTVCVDFGPSMIFVETRTLVTGGNVTLSVSTTVTGAGV